LCLDVSCSILVFTFHSATNQIPFLIIHRKYHTILNIFNATLIAGNNLGIFGGGGKLGNSIVGKGGKEGKSGSCGGAGNLGNAGKVKLAFKSGKSGSVNNHIGTGKIFIFGKIISIPKFI
jgi:hypothetical protein